MKSAPIPDNEEARLAVLRALELLDQPPDEMFDRITRLLSRALHVPIALISLIDADRQWFLSKVGLDADETPRALAFCAHVVADQKALTVEDATKDERFADNPLVTQDPNIRFYAGVPITSQGGYVLGTLCAIDTKSRVLDQDQQNVLADLAGLLQREIIQREAAGLVRAALVRSRELVEEQQVQFRSVFDCAGVGIALVSPVGGWISVNPALCKIVGYSEDELLRLTFQDITHPDDLDSDLNLLAQLVAGEVEQYSLEKRYVRKDGKLIWIKLTAAARRDELGRPEYFVSIVEDIESRKQAEFSLSSLRRDLEQRVQQRTVELSRVNEALSLTLAQQVESDKALVAREAELSAVIENAHDAYVSINESGVIESWNRQAELTFGWSADDAIGRLLDETIIPMSYREAHRHGMKRYAETGEANVLNARIEITAMRRDSTIFPVEIRIRALELQGRRTFNAFLHDISERKIAEAALQAAQEQLRTIADNLPVLIAYVDRDLRFRYNNAAYEKVFKRTPESLVGVRAAELIGDAEVARWMPWVQRVLSGERIAFDSTFEHEGKTRYWLNTYVPHTVHGEVIGFHAMIQDVTTRRVLELLREKEARQDTLTELPNRRALLEILPLALARARRASKPLAVLFLDLDGFKAINDTLGHEAGDTVLKEVALRLRANLRETDVPARLAGDEFVILLEGLADASTDAHYVASKLVAAIAEPMHVGASLVSPGASIGIAISAGDASETPEGLLKLADAAMYKLKTSRKTT